MKDKKSYCVTGAGADERWTGERKTENGRTDGRDEDRIWETESVSDQDQNISRW